MWRLLDWSQSASRERYGLRAVDERCLRIGGGGGLRMGSRESVHVPLTGHYVTRTRQCWNRHDMRTRDKLFKIMTRVSYTFLTRHGSMIGVSVLLDWTRVVILMRVKFWSLQMSPPLSHFSDFVEKWGSEIYWQVPFISSFGTCG